MENNEDYIRRDLAKGAVATMLGLENLHTVSIIFEAIDLIRAADVEEVRHGEWVKDISVTGKPLCWCKACGCVVKNKKTDQCIDLSDAPYCPHCGAAMRTKERDIIVENTH